MPLLAAAPGDAPVGHDEFAALMARLGPWGHGRAVAVAVSGGADSLCLAWLAASWSAAAGAAASRSFASGAAASGSAAFVAATHALVVDHGLRARSAAEADATAATLATLGVPARILRLRGLARGPALAERARRARYAALLAACAELGLADLLLGHHAGDQAETVLMRRLSASGPDGLAGMAPLATHGPCRLLRPLLAILPGRLRRTLRDAGIAWIEDPSNRDPAALRTRLRARLAASGESPALLSAARDHAGRRHAAESATAAALARIATLRPEGFAVLAPGPWPPAVLAAVLRTIGGHPYPPDPRGVARLAASPRAATLGGARLLPAGRLGPGWLVLREAAAMSPPVAAAAGAVWDSRFRIAGEGDPALTLGALGADAGRGTRGGLPAAIRATLPALRRDGRVVAVPHEAADGPETFDFRPVRLVFDPPAPASPAPFDTALGEGDAAR